MRPRASVALFVACVTNTPSALAQANLLYEQPTNFLTNTNVVLAFAAPYGGFNFYSVGPTVESGVTHRQEVAGYFDVPPLSTWDWSFVRFLSRPSCADNSTVSIALYEDAGGLPGAPIYERWDPVRAFLGTVQIGVDIYAHMQVAAVPAPSSIVNDSPLPRRVWLSLAGGDSCAPRQFACTQGLPNRGEGAFRCATEASCPAGLAADRWWDVQDAMPSPDTVGCPLRFQVHGSASSLPAFRAAFAPDTAVFGVPSTLTFTLTNPTDAPYTNVAFDDPFPQGLVVATPSNATTTCAGGVITAPGGATGISFAGAVLPAHSRCEVMVDVVSTSRSTFVNTTSTLTSTEVADLGTATASLTVAGEQLVLTVGAGGAVLVDPPLVSCSADCDLWFASGTSVTLTPEPVMGFMFAGWSGDADCSDGIVTVGGTVSCTASFTLAPYCGDGTQDPGEECDAGSSNSDTIPNACRTTCHLPKCGDGVADTGEACDLGMNPNPSLCLPDCTLPMGTSASSATASSTSGTSSGGAAAAASGASASSTGAAASSTGAAASSTGAAASSTGAAASTGSGGASMGGASSSGASSGGASAASAGSSSGTAASSGVSRAPSSSSSGGAAQSAATSGATSTASSPASSSSNAAGSGGGSSSGAGVSSSSGAQDGDGSNGGGGGNGAVGCRASGDADVGGTMLLLGVAWLARAGSRRKR